MSSWLWLLLCFASSVVWYGAGYSTALRKTPRSLARLTPEQLHVLAGKVAEEKVKT